jgi:small subunit ribosomal protein S20
MPVTKSAIKAHKQSLTKRSRNKHFVALYKETLKKFERAIAVGAADVGEILSHLQSAIDTLVKKNVLHANTAARRKSAHAKTLAKMGSALAPVSVAKAPKAPKAAPAKKAVAKTETEATPEKTVAPKKAPAKKAK